MTRANNLSSERILILTPQGRDAAVAQSLLKDADLSSVIITALPDLVQHLSETAATVLLTEEALVTADLHALATWLAEQPAWSDMPFILLTRQGGGLERNPGAARLSTLLGNVTFLERPFHPTTLISLVQTALRGRRRQYEARARLEDLRASEDRLRDLNATIEQRVAQEVGERALAEEALRQSQKMEAVGQLTGGIAHDFNNLLTAITGGLDLLQMRVAQGRTKDIGRYIDMAQGAAKRAAALTHRLLAFSRRQTLAPKSTDVNRLVAELEDLIRRTVGPAIRVETVMAADLWNTLVDPGQLENAVLNLCINARDAMPDGGAIVIETGNVTFDRPANGDWDLPPGRFVTVSVSDNGTGMPPDVVARAFDPFFTTKPLGQGTGLGLSMIYGFARQSGGQVRIYSEVGDGTRVCLYLPRHAGEEDGGSIADSPAEMPRARQGETVLVVDDETSVRMLVTDVLADLGYGALEAADGAAGLTILRSDARIDLLVTDVGLPGGMNGRQVADAARQLRPDLKVLFITGYAENAVLSHGHLDPGMHVLTKPFAIDALAERMRSLIEE